MAMIPLSPSATIFVVIMNAGNATYWGKDSAVLVKNAFAPDLDGEDEYPPAVEYELHPYVATDPTPDEQKFISTPQGVEISAQGDYYYDPKAGEGVTVYILDFGVDTENGEFADLAGKWRWLWPTQDFWKNHYNEEYYEGDQDPDGHGTCIMSKIAGQRYGTAKKANIVIASYLSPMSGEENIRELELLSRVREDILKKTLAGKAVVNLSFGHVSDDQEYIKAMRTILDAMLQEDVVVIIASGNEAKTRSPDIDEYPALLRKDLPQLIVVGSVNVDGSPSHFSQGGQYLDISAPGSYSDTQGIRCATNRDTNSYALTSGTSYASPSIAGLAAYLMSVNARLGSLRQPGLTAQKTKSKLLELAYARKELTAAFNGYIPADGGDEACVLDKRQGSSSCKPGSRQNTDPWVINGVTLVGNPASLVANGQATVTAGGAAITVAQQTFSLPASASGGAIYVDGKMTTLSNKTVPTASGPNKSSMSLSSHGPKSGISSTVSTTSFIASLTATSAAHSITSIPSNVPGHDGLPACHGLVFTTGISNDCPYAIDGWCECQGIKVPPLAPTGSVPYINCALSTMPSVNSCPVNTAYSASLASAHSASAAAASYAAAHPPGPTETSYNHDGSR